MNSITISGVPHVYEFTPCQSATSTNTPVLIFIHGWLLSRYYWQPLIEKLTSQYACLSYDLRGFGDSLALDPEDSSLSSKYDLASYAHDLKLLLQELKIEQAWLIGHSLGGSIALWNAYCCPRQIQGVICVNAGGGIYLKEEFERFRNAGMKIVKQRPSWLCKIPLIDLIFARTMVVKPLDRRWGKQRVLDFVKADEKAALGSLMEATTEEQVHLLPQLVSQLEQPTYFIAGDQDKVMELKYVHHLASFHSLFEPHGQNVIEVSNCGHFAMLEHPEIVSEKIKDILEYHDHSGLTDAPPPLSSYQ
jgi:2-succinyl-6-hydroxy-2,4-cyclohexadiene-1-carboxylate synthase